MRQYETSAKILCLPTVSYDGQQECEVTKYEKWHHTFILNLACALHFRGRTMGRTH